MIICHSVRNSSPAPVAGPPHRIFVTNLPKRKEMQKPGSITSGQDITRRCREDSRVLIRFTSLQRFVTATIRTFEEWALEPYFYDQLTDGARIERSLYANEIFNGRRSLVSPQWSQGFL